MSQSPTNPTPKPKTTTEHAPVVDGTNAPRVAVDHETYDAVQYDFYIPSLISESPQVKEFIQRLDSIAAGATRFEGLTGVWEGDQESSGIYRKIIRRDKLDPEELRAAIREEVGQLMAELSTSPRLTQNAVMFTETPIAVTLSSHVRDV